MDRLSCCESDLSKHKHGILDHLTWSAVVLALSLMTKLFVSSWVWVFLILIPMTVFLISLKSNTKWLGYLIAHRTRFVFGVVSVFLLIGLIVYLDVYRVLPEDWRLVGRVLSFPNQEARLDIVVGFGLLGIVLGALLRQALGRAVYGTLLRSWSIGPQITIIGIWTTVVILCPYPVHPYAVSYYIWGIAMGMLVHKAVHLWFERRMETYRRMSNIYAAWPDQTQGSKQEHKALEYFRNHKIKRLRKELDKWKNKGVYSKKLALLSASLYRIEGQYERSNQDIDSATKADAIESLEDTHLLMLKAVNLRERQRDSEAQQLLQILTQSEHGKTCPLVHAAQAFLQSDEIMKDITRFQPSQRALKSAYRSMMFRYKLVQVRDQTKRSNALSELQDFYSRVMDYCIPVNATLILDTMGYALLAAGYSYEAKVFFQECITMDPTYSSAYLHLGDYYQVRMLACDDASSQARFNWHASLCYYAAKYSENVIDSRISAMTGKRLESL